MEPETGTTMETAGKPQALLPKPSTPHPQPSTFHPEALNPKS